MGVCDGLTGGSTLGSTRVKIYTCNPDTAGRIARLHTADTKIARRSCADRGGGTMPTCSSRNGHRDLHSRGCSWGQHGRARSNHGCPSTGRARAQRNGVGEAAIVGQNMQIGHQTARQRTVAAPWTECQSSHIGCGCSQVHAPDNEWIQLADYGKVQFSQHPTRRSGGNSDFDRKAAAGTDAQTDSIATRQRCRQNTKTDRPASGIACWIDREDVCIVAGIGDRKTKIEG